MDTNKPDKPRAEVGKFGPQWWVVAPGTRGGIAVAGRSGAIALCKSRGWTPVDSDGRELKPRK